MSDVDFVIGKNILTFSIVFCRYTNRIITVDSIAIVDWRKKIGQAILCNQQ